MRFLLLLAAASVFPTMLHAQVLEPTARPRKFLVGQEQAPLYLSLADTVNHHPLLLPPGTEVTTVGELNAQWVKVQVKRFYFIMKPTLLVGYPVRVPKLKPKTEDSAPTLPLDAETHLVAYTAVVPVANATQDQLFARAYEWIAKNYPAAGNALMDKAKGRITIQGTTHPRYKGNEFGTVTHTFNIYVKEGKYKYDFTNFRHDYLVPGQHGGDASLGPFENENPKKMVMMEGLLHRVWNTIRNQTDTQMKERIAELDKAMQGTGKDKGDF